METPTTSKEKDRLEDTKEFASVALNSLTNEMVTDLAGKAVQAVELMDDILQPETISLMKKLPEVSKSLEGTLATVQRLEESGTLQTLSEMGEMVATMKASMTTPMITDMVEKAIGGVEMADEIVQHGSLELVQGMSKAFAEARHDRETADKPMTTMQMVKMMKDPEVREGLSLFLTFVKHLPGELNLKK
ncbi:DUF1641 domain-containing protein [Bacillus marinisedimentorum]|uniref:DUF1641 domain-containing protein n=1 Tax=Bacillus marinisedimentorum TaxID=1821260 RepID=UPI00087258C2|nr:DUF1641 domain-containing protein [Bacillus marinisedimentorum]